VRRQSEKMQSNLWIAIFVFSYFHAPHALATFNPASYPRYQQLDPSMLIYWKMQSDSIQMAIRVRSS
jgi:hypothetical protein